jgi:colicin import membrane protein
MQKTGAEVPEYGTITQRQAVGIYEFVDPKGRKPVHYTKVMKKYKLTQERVEEEAGKFEIVIDPQHFVVPEGDVKRGRPAAAAKEPKAKGVKGRPKKEKKVLTIEGDDEDLFGSLVAQAISTEEAEEEIVMKPKKAGKTEEEKEAERIAKEEEKQKKKMLAEHAKEQAKAEKEAKLAALKAEKEAKLAAAKAEKEAKLAAEKAEKEAKKLAAEQAKEAAKKEKEEKLAAEKAAKEAAKKPAAKKPAAKKEEPEEDEEPEVVKKIEFEGKKYLISKKSGIIYDLLECKENGEQVILGKWNEAKNKIDFNEKGEESEEEYDD